MFITPKYFFYTGRFLCGPPPCFGEGGSPKLLAVKTFGDPPSKRKSFGDPPLQKKSRKSFGDVDFFLRAQRARKFSHFFFGKTKNCLTKTRSTPHICGVQKLIDFLYQLEATEFWKKVLEAEKSDFWRGGFWPKKVVPPPSFGERPSPKLYKTFRGGAQRIWPAILQ